MKCVSVIVPVYNSEDYLERCLESLVNQTLEGVEIVVVNDGSSDGSQAIIDAYAERFPGKIVALTKENGGLSDARNHGIRHASGEYLGFVDSDDYVDLDMYERLYARAVETDSDLVCCPITYAWETRNERHYFTRTLKRFGRRVAESPNVLTQLNSFACNKIYRRSFWEQCGFEFPVGQAFEDSAIIYNIAYLANRVEAVNIPFYYYVRYRGESITNASDDRIYDIFRSCDSILEFYRSRPEYPAMKNAVEYLCIKHIMVRFNLLSRSDDKSFVRAYMNHAYAYIDKKIPDWRANSYFAPSKASKTKTKAVRFLRSQEWLTKAYYTSPRELRSAPRELSQATRQFRSRVRAKLGARGDQRRKAEIDSGKASRIQARGYQMIAAVQELLGRVGVTCFADFGTLLGLVREHRLLAHDLDIDLGVIVNTKADIARIRTAMERFGFKVWREYYRGDEMVESSFRMLRIKVDLSYYRVDETSAKTWLFYRDPEKTYGPRDRDIVELAYSPIREMTTVRVQDVDIQIPANAEQLLTEKYGPTWRTPDKGWVYWKSPAATPIDDAGRFVTYEYIGGFTRAEDPQDEELFERLYRLDLSGTATALREDSELRRLQLRELSILHEVDRVCRENGITYYLGEGTLLGAVRHQGFIPWDDDIDILMPRADYDRFLDLAPRLVSPGFEVQHWTLTPRYWSAFAKVRLLDNSEFYQPPIEHLTSNNGPYLDIFPLDSVPEAASQEQDRQKRLMTRYRKSLSYKRGDTRPKTRRTKLIRLFSYFVTVPWLYRKLEYIYRALEKPGNRYWVNLASYYSAAKETFPVEMYGAPRLAVFEDGLFPVPAQAEAMLEQIYGEDYLLPPPVEKRQVKHAMRYRAEQGGRR